MNPWVRDKALQVVIALREIRPGDEIQLRLCANEYHRVVTDAAYVREPYVVVQAIDEHHRWPVDIYTLEHRHSYSTCWCGIRAWRRPHG